MKFRLKDGSLYSPINPGTVKVFEFGTQIYESDDPLDVRHQFDSCPCDIIYNPQTMTEKKVIHRCAECVTLLDSITKNRTLNLQFGNKPTPDQIKQINLAKQAEYDRLKTVETSTQTI